MVTDPADLIDLPQRQLIVDGTVQSIRYVFILTRAPGETTGSYFFAMGDTFGRFSLSADGATYVRAAKEGGMDRDLDTNVVNRLLS